MTKTTTPNNPKPLRLRWPDVAKGISILGVVILHVSITVPDAELTWLHAVNVWIDPMRMPLFFLISGLFSVKIFRFTFVELFSRRLWFFLIPYLVWVSVELYAKYTELYWATGSEKLTWQDLSYHLLFGHNMGWFLHALIIFNIALWAMRRLPGWAIIVLSFTPILFLPWDTQFYFVGKATMFFPVFVVGAVLRKSILAYADNVDTPWTKQKRTFQPVIIWSFVVAFFTYMVGFAIRRYWDTVDINLTMNWPLPGRDIIEFGQINLLVRLVEQFLQLPMAIAGAVAIAHIPYIAGFFAFIGRHTLPIYLGHPIALTVGFQYLRIFTDIDMSIDGPWPWGATWMWVIVCMFYAAVGSLMVWSIGRVPVLGWSVNPPRIAGRLRTWKEPMVSGGEQGTGEPPKNLHR